MRVFVCVCVHMCVFVFVYARVCACICVCMCIYMCVCVCVQMKAKGITVLAQEERQLTEDEAREFYAHLQGEVSHSDGSTCHSET